MGKKGSILVILLIGTVIVLSLGSAGYLFLQNRQLQSQLVKNIAPVQTPAPVPTPVPVIDPTANWKTYTNTRYGYSVNYPPNIVYQESQTEGAIIGQQETTTTFVLNDAILTISGNAGGRGLEGLETTPLSLNVGGISTYKVYTSPTSGIVSAILSPKNDEIYFSFVLPEDINKRKNIDDIFDQILSTFKFL